MKSGCGVCCLWPLVCLHLLDCTQPASAQLALLCALVFCPLKHRHFQHHPRAPSVVKCQGAWQLYHRAFSWSAFLSPLHWLSGKSGALQITPKGDFSRAAQQTPPLPFQVVSICRTI